MIFTGHYVAAEQKGCILIELYANNGLQFQQQRQKNSKEYKEKKPHSLIRAGLAWTESASWQKMMHKKYVSHYSNKNGQFILRNVQILCIIYITFFASAFFSLSLSLPSHCYRTFFYYTHIKHTLHFIHSFSCLVRFTLATIFPTYSLRVFFRLSLEDDAYRCACCLLCLQFFRILWRKKNGKQNKTSSNTHDVTLSSFICVFCADTWPL